MQKILRRFDSSEQKMNTESLPISEIDWFPDQGAALSEIFRVLAPKGRLLVSLVNPPLELMSRAGRALSDLAGEPANWPTRARLRRLLGDAGFDVESQRLVLRIPGTLLLPSVLTVARRPS